MYQGQYLVSGCTRLFQFASLDQIFFRGCMPPDPPSKLRASRRQLDASRRQSFPKTIFGHPPPPTNSVIRPCFKTLAPACLYLASDVEQSSVFLEGRKSLPVFSQSEARCIFFHEGGKGYILRGQLAAISCCVVYVRERQFYWQFLFSLLARSNALRLETCVAPLTE